MSGKLFDIEASIANMGICFANKSVGRSHFYQLGMTLLGLFTVGVTSTFIGLEKVLSSNPNLKAEWYHWLFIVFGIVLITIGILVPKLSKKLRTINNLNTGTHSFESAILALEELGYLVLDKSNNEIRAEKNLKRENAELHFLGFVKNNILYYAIYKTNRGGISLLSLFTKSIAVEEFNQSFHQEIINLSNQQKK